MAKGPVQFQAGNSVESMRAGAMKMGRDLDADLVVEVQIATGGTVPKYVVWKIKGTDNTGQ